MTRPGTPEGRWREIPEAGEMRLRGRWADRMNQRKDDAPKVAVALRFQREREQEEREKDIYQ